VDLGQAIALALLQGLTEFLPISSSAHLILVPRLLGWADQGLAFDVAVHVGTLAAVTLYFRKDLTRMILAWIGSLRGARPTADSRLAWGVILATVPLGLAGLLLKSIVETELRSPLVIAWATLLFGVLLWWVYSRFGSDRSEYALKMKEMLFIGCAQALALIPGTSRSGITITAGLMLGLSPRAAARFSFLLSIPAIVLPGGLHLVGLREQTARVPWLGMVTGTLVSAIAAYACIHYFLALLERIGMVPFVLYRLALGAGLLYLFA